MKKSLLLIFALFSILPAGAAYFEVDNIWYLIRDETQVEVISKQISQKYTGEVKIPETVTYEGTVYAVTAIGARAFGQCDELTAVEIPNSVTQIQMCAFIDCTELKSISIPNSVTTLSENLIFSGCTNLTSAILPESLSAIPKGLFNKCKSLVSIELPAGLKAIGDYAFAGCEKLASIELPSSVLSIGDRAFDECIGLETVILSDVLETIGSDAFRECYQLKSIRIPDTVTAIGASAFCWCENLATIELTSSISKIETNTFYACSSLQAIEIPDQVTEIGFCAFADCEQLKQIKLPSGLTHIPESCFENTGLTSLVIPDRVTTIGKTAFHNSTSLASVVIPSSVTAIGEDAFSYSAKRMKAVTVAWTTPFVLSSDDEVFSITRIQDAVLYVPEGSKADYSKAEVWKHFGKIVEYKTEGIRLEPADGQIVLSLDLPQALSVEASFVLKLPSGFTLNKEKTTLAPGFASKNTLTLTDQDDQSVLFSIAPSLQRTSGGDSNAFLELYYTVADDVEPGEYDVQIANLCLVGDDETHIRIDALSASLRVEERSIADALYTPEFPSIVVRDGLLLSVDTPQAEVLTLYSESGLLLYRFEKKAGLSAFTLSDDHSILIIQGSSGWSRKIAR